MLDIITRLLEKRLSKVAADIPLDVAYENIAFTTKGGSYLTSYVIPAQTRTIGLDETIEVYQGIYQINVVVSINTGKSKAQNYAKQIIDHFPINLELTEGDFTLFINSKPTAYKAIQDTTTYTLPISMKYRADYSTN